MPKRGWSHIPTEQWYERKIKIVPEELPDFSPRGEEDGAVTEVKEEPRSAMLTQDSDSGPVIQPLKSTMPEADKAAGSNATFPSSRPPHMSPPTSAPPVPMALGPLGIAPATGPTGAGKGGSSSSTARMATGSPGVGKVRNGHHIRRQSQ